MAYIATGTAGNDTLNQSSDTGPGTIVGLAGDDCIFTGSGLATVTGDSGNDLVILRTGNTGTVNGGTENDSIVDNGTQIGSMQLFGGDGADFVDVFNATGALTIVGGNDSNDGPDELAAGLGPDLIFGNGGDDGLFGGGGGPDTMVGGFGHDAIFSGEGANNLVFGNQGNDSILVNGRDTVWAGQGNDSVALGTSTASPQLFLNEGNDTVGLAEPYAGPITIVGGNDSADGSDSIVIGTGPGLVFGNGGADTLVLDTGADTGVAGFGNDSVRNNGGNNILFGNEGNDTVDSVAAGANTVFGGLGNDTISMTGTGRDTLQGNEGNDTIRGALGIDTLAGGSGNDVFAYGAPDEDGNNAAGGGPVELITDVDFAVDRFDTNATITFAANIGAGTGTDLNSSTNNAITAATALNGGVNTVAAQFTFGGRTYLAINLANNGFLDADDLLVDITGATGTIGSGNFI
jgi:Ca2+-binding RTX toxin-like protein